MRPALAVMVKAPRPGQVKTRLVPPLTPGQAAELYRRFLKDIFARLSSLSSNTDIFAAYAPEGARGELEGLLPEGVFFIEQEGADLGERMFNVFNALHAEGCGAVALIGSDAPDVPKERIGEAFRALEGGADAVFGPAVDGGYYLVGLKRPTRVLFEGIEWSTPTVMEKTIERLEALAIPYSLLPEWHDIDRPGDLALIRGNPACPESSSYLVSLGF